MKPFLTVGLILSASLSSFAQSRIILPAPPRNAPVASCPFSKLKPVPILVRNPYKIKAASVTSSENARVADYVEFQTMEDIYSMEKYPKVLFKAGTTIFAIVTWRKHRGFPFRRGQLEIGLQPLVNWDGTEVQIGIRRHGMVRPEPDEAKLRNKPCRKAVDGIDCVAGRRDAKVAPIVPAMAGAAATAVTALAKDDDDTRFIAATAFFSIAKEIGELLNGTDALIRQNEIFDLYIDPGSAVCRVPEPDKPKPPPTEVIILKQR